jgi:hypothetical protein
MRQTKEQRKVDLTIRAVEMAASGKYRNWEQIKFALCFDEGYVKRADGYAIAPGANRLTSSAEKRRTCACSKDQPGRRAANLLT